MKRKLRSRVIYGEGIKTNQEFSSYTFIKPKGTFKINKLED